MSVIVPKYQPKRVNFAEIKVVHCRDINSCRVYLCKYITQNDITIAMGSLKNVFKCTWRCAFWFPYGHLNYKTLLIYDENSDQRDGHIIIMPLQGDITFQDSNELFICKRNGLLVGQRLFKASFEKQFQLRGVYIPWKSLEYYVKCKTMNFFEPCSGCNDEIHSVDSLVAFLESKQTVRKLYEYNGSVLTFGIDGTQKLNVCAIKLVDNYLKHRKDMKKEMKRLPLTATLLTNSDFQQMCFHYGHHKILLSTNSLFNKIISFGALEQYFNISRFKYSQEFPVVERQLMNLIDREKFFVKIDHTSYCRLMYDIFVKLFVVVTVNDGSMMMAQIELCNRKIYLGFVMVSCAKYIHTYLQRLSVKKIKKSFFHYVKEYSHQTIAKWKTIIAEKSKEIKHWTIKNFLQKGKQFVMSKENIFVINGNPVFAHVMAEISRIVDGDFDKAEMYYTKAVCDGSYLCDKVRSLRSLSYCCYVNEQYCFGYKILKCAHKLSIGFMFPSFVKTVYFEKRKLFKMQINQLKCSNCGLKKSKMRVCCGCMKVVYCNRTCQKRGWNSNHREKCINVWNSLYHAFKGIIFDRL
eukprot:39329_1